MITSAELGNEIGIYILLGESEQRAKDGHKKYHVRCKFCNREFDAKLSDIKRPRKCYHFDRHFWIKPRLRTILRGMKRRCYNPSDRAYCSYGQKGIRVCDEWLDNPGAFEEWALINGYQDDLTIDRIDENKDYEPSNCRWISRSDNAKYKSTTTLLDVDGVIHTGRDWAEILSLGTNVINIYLRKYPMDTVKEFIRRRLDNPNITRKSKQTWLDAYGLS